MTTISSSRFLAALSGLLILPAAAFSIELGDSAPPLQIQEWVQGKPVNLAEGNGKQIYVVEFWATWCGPCRTSIPHLSKLQENYKDKNLTVIGISDEKPAKIKPFVKKMAEDMNYTVAADKDRATYQAYMQAFGVNGIPHAFIVNQEGKLAWHGHPMVGMDTVIDQILAGTYDIAAAQKAAQVEALLPEYLTAVAENNRTEEIEKMGWKIVTEGGSNPAMMNQFAWIILTHPRIQYRDLKLATAAAKKAYDVTGAKDPAVIDTYARALFDSGNKEEAIKLQRKAISICTEEALKKGLEQTLNRYLEK